MDRMLRPVGVALISFIACASVGAQVVTTPGETAGIIREANDQMYARVRDYSLEVRWKEVFDANSVEAAAGKEIRSPDLSRLLPLLGRAERDELLRRLVEKHIHSDPILKNRLFNRNVNYLGIAGAAAGGALAGMKYGMVGGIGGAALGGVIGATLGAAVGLWVEHRNQRTTAESYEHFFKESYARHLPEGRPASSARPLEETRRRAPSAALAPATSPFDATKRSTRVEPPTGTGAPVPPAPQYKERALDEFDDLRISGNTR